MITVLDEGTVSYARARTDVFQTHSPNTPLATSRTHSCLSCSGASDSKHAPTHPAPAKGTVQSSGGSPTGRDDTCT